MAISLASSLAAELLQKGVPVSLSGNMTDILSKEPVSCEAGVHKSHLEKMDRRLALADTEQLSGSFARVDQKEWERRGDRQMLSGDHSRGYRGHSGGGRGKAHGWGSCLWDHYLPGG